MSSLPGKTKVDRVVVSRVNINLPIRKGVKFHNGRELVASDIKYSIERTVNPETQSPGQGFFWHFLLD